MENKVVVNEENENLKNQAKGWGVFLVALASCGVFGLGTYSVMVAIFVTICALGVDVYLYRKNKKVETE